LIILGLILVFIPVTDFIFLLVRSPLVAISFGSSQQLVGGDVSSFYGGEGRPCRGDVRMAGTGAVEESRCREDDVLGGLSRVGCGLLHSREGEVPL
jgi:hypothetical protein